ncbi:MAG: hypothetical protein WBB34_11030 [Xanthobacteraceae bacterium]
MQRHNLNVVTHENSHTSGVSPDDMLITLYEAPGENFSFGQGEAQRANAVLS